MKQLIAATSALALAAGIVLADQGVIIKQKAKDIRDQNNERQGVTPPSPSPGGAAPATAPATPPTPAPPVLTSQQQGLSKMLTYFNALKSGSSITAEQKEQFATDLLSIAQGATKPSEKSVTKLANDLTTSLTDKNLTGPQRARLAQNVQAVLNSANIS